MALAEELSISRSPEWNTESSICLTESTFFDDVDHKLAGVMALIPQGLSFLCDAPAGAP
jgi:hypothetical protein